MSLPSLVAPNLSLILPPAAGPDPSKTERRSITILTGKPPDLRDSVAATGSR